MRRTIRAARGDRKQYIAWRDDADALYCVPVEVDLAPLGHAVRQLRQARGLTLKTLAEQAGLSERFLSDLERGRGNISVGRLLAVARALGTGLAPLVAALDADAPPPRPVVALIGLRGAGKSTIGPRVARSLGARFVELDLEVEAAAGLALGEVFELHGEAYYRRLERETLRRLLAAREEPLVIAAGGGLVTDPGTWRALSAEALTVWLRAEAGDHYQRVVDQGDLRPMRNRPAAMAELRALLAARSPLYARADVTVDTSRLGLDGAVRRVVEAARAGRSGP
jgi:XRE family aerobic/anaerobic benzoate catabolism transcriptional regulator